MKKITIDACKAFEAGYKYKNTNTEITISNDGKLAEFYLFGNLIATKLDNKINITLAGWNSSTTRERLNGLPGVRVTTKQGQVYLNGKEWDGAWITVTPAGDLIN